MVQVIPAKTNIGSKIGQSIGGGLHQGLSQGFQQHLLPQNQGLDPEIEKRNYGVIKDAFGEKFANVWQATGQGERTNLTRAALEAASRGQNVRQLFDNLPDEMLPKGAQAQRDKEGFPQYRLKTEGMTPKETISYKQDLRKENTPFFDESIKKYATSTKELRTLKTLTNLNEGGKLPKDLGKWLINPKTGEPYKAAQLAGQVSEDTQHWIKTVNEFTSKAKDVFGSRVTNFDLETFKTTLPGLMNTYEGRQRIIKQMELLAEGEKLKADALKKVYRHYGKGEITPEDATEIAEQLVDDDLEKLAMQLDAISAPPTRQTKQESGNRPSLADIFG